MMPRRQLSQKAKELVIRQLGRLFAQRWEVLFACIHGSFSIPDLGFHDINVGVWVEPSEVTTERALEYSWDLDSWLERHVPYSIDAKVLNYASMGLRYAAGGGLLVFARDEELRYQFRGETWMHYLDFAPLSKQMLFDLLGASQP